MFKVTNLLGIIFRVNDYRPTAVLYWKGAVAMTQAKTDRAYAG